MLFLVLTVVLSSAVPVFAAKDSQCIEELFEFLNISIDPAAEETTINRAEAARLYCLTLGFEPSDGLAAFEDISGNKLSGYAVTAYKMGWITVESDKKFEPSGEISCYDFARGFVKGLGYTVQAQNSSYDLYIARLKLFSGVNDGSETALTARNAAIIIDNALNAPLMIQTKFGDNAEFISSEQRNLLTEVHSLKLIEGYVTADEKTSIYSNEGVGVGKIKIADEIYRTEISREKILGQYVKAYLYSVRDEEIIKAIFINENKSKAIDISFDENTAVYTEDGTVLKYETGGRTYKKSVNINASFIYNGSFDADYHLTDINNMRLGNIRLLDNNRDGKVDIVFVDEYTNYVINDVYTTKIFDKYGQTPIDIEGKDTEFVSITKKGEEVGLDSLKEWNVASVYKSRDNRIIRIVISDDSILEQITAKEVANGYTLYKILDEYRVSAICGTPDYTLKVSDWGRFYYDAYGRIAAVDLKSDTVTYGFLLGAHIGIFEENPKFKIMTVLGKCKIFDGMNKIKLDGVMVNAEQAVNAVAIKPQIIAYNVNPQEKISEIKTVDGGGIKLSASGVSGLWRTTSLALGSKYIAGADTVIFGVPSNLTDLDESDITVISASSLVNTQNYSNVDVYDLDDMKVAGAFVMRGFDRGINTSESIYFVREVGRTLSNSGDSIDVIYYTQNGNEGVLYTDEKTTGKILPGTGVRVTQSANGDVTDVSIEFTGMEADFLDTYVAGDSNHGVGAACVKLMGVIDKIGEDMFSIEGSDYIYINSSVIACYEYDDGRHYFSDMSFYELNPGDRVFIVKSRDIVTNIIKMPN